MDQDDRERVLAGFDRLSKQFVAQAAPVRFTLATTPEAVEATRRLRARIVIERGGALPGELPNGIERDHHDERAVHIAGWSGDILVATARIVFPFAGERLPTEDYFELTDPPAWKVANLDWMIVDRGLSDPAHQVLVALICRSWLELRAHGYHRWIGVVTPAMLRLYRRLSVHVTPIGPAQVYWGEHRIPCFFDPFDDFVANPVAGDPRTIEQWEQRQIEAITGDQDMSQPG